MIITKQLFCLLTWLCGAICAVWITFAAWWFLLQASNLSPSLEIGRSSLGVVRIVVDTRQNYWCWDRTDYGVARRFRAYRETSYLPIEQGSPPHEMRSHHSIASDYDRFSYFAVGWPFLCLCSTVVEANSGDVDIANMNRVDIMEGLFFIVPNTSGLNAVDVFPRVIVSGIILNAVIYGVILRLFYSLIVFAHRKYKSFLSDRGSCCKCGYAKLSSEQPCSECGH